MATLSDTLGTWISKKDLTMRTGTTVFTLPQGRTIKVSQVDNKTNKVLIDAGSRCIDWVHVTTLQNFEKID